MSIFAASQADLRRWMAQAHKDLTYALVQEMVYSNKEAWL